MSYGAHSFLRGALCVLGFVCALSLIAPAHAGLFDDFDIGQPNQVPHEGGRATLTKVHGKTQSGGRWGLDVEIRNAANQISRQHKPFSFAGVGRFGKACMSASYAGIACTAATTLGPWLISQGLGLGDDGSIYEPGTATNWDECSGTFIDHPDGSRVRGYYPCKTRPTTSKPVYWTAEPSPVLDDYMDQSGEQLDTLDTNYLTVDAPQTLGSGTVYGYSIDRDLVIDPSLSGDRDIITDAELGEIMAASAPLQAYEAGTGVFASGLFDDAATGPDPEPEPEPEPLPDECIQGLPFGLPDIPRVWVDGCLTGDDPGDNLVDKNLSEVAIELTTGESWLPQDCSALKYDIDFFGETGVIDSSAICQPTKDYIRPVVIAAAWFIALVSVMRALEVR